MRGAEPAAIMHDLGFGPLILIAQFPVKMSGSGRSFTAYVFSKASPSAVAFIEKARALGVAPAALVAGGPSAQPTPSRPHDDLTNKAAGAGAGAVGAGVRPRALALEELLPGGAAAEPETSQCDTVRREGGSGSPAKKTRTSCEDLAGAVAAERQQQQQAQQEEEVTSADRTDKPTTVAATGTEAAAPTAAAPQQPAARKPQAQKRIVDAFDKRVKSGTAAAGAVKKAPVVDASKEAPAAADAAVSGRRSQRLASKAQ